MAYSRVWNSATPLGNAPAETVDDTFRNIKGDLEERLEDKLIVDITADPWVLKDEVRGKFTNKIIMLGPAHFDTGSDTASGFNIPASPATPLYRYLQVGSAAVAHCSLSFLPTGCTIKNVELLAERENANCSGITLNIFRYGFDVGNVATLEETVGSAAAGKHIITTGVLPVAGDIGAITVDTTSMLELYIVATILPASNGAARIFGARITYDIPALF